MLEVFKGKNILLVCAEIQAWPMHYVAEELRAQCSSISAIFIQPGEAYFNAPDFSLFNELNEDIKIYEMSGVIDEYLTKQNSAHEYVDRKYIEYIEKNYTNYSILNEQFLSEMTMLPYYHDRNYYKFVDYDRILLYTQLYYKYIEQIFLTNKPDLILDSDIDFFGRAVLFEVANAYAIPYISIDHTRVNGYVLPTDALCKRVNNNVKKCYQNSLADNSIDKDDYLLKFANDVQKSIGKIPKIFEKEHDKFKFNSYKLIRELLIQIVISIVWFSPNSFCLTKSKVSQRQFAEM